MLLKLQYAIHLNIYWCSKRWLFYYYKISASEGNNVFFTLKKTKTNKQKKDVLFFLWCLTLKKTWFIWIPFLFREIRNYKKCVVIPDWDKSSCVWKRVLMLEGNERQRWVMGTVLKIFSKSLNWNHWASGMQIVFKWVLLLFSIFLSLFFFFFRVILKWLGLIYHTILFLCFCFIKFALSNVSFSWLNNFDCSFLTFHYIHWLL